MVCGCRSEQGGAGWSVARVQAADGGMWCTAVPAQSTTPSTTAEEEAELGPQAVLGEWRSAHRGAETTCSVQTRHGTYDFRVLETTQPVRFNPTPPPSYR
jgi:hypothetical protein